MRRTVAVLMDGEVVALVKPGQVVDLRVDPGEHMLESRMGGVRSEPVGVIVRHFARTEVRVGMRSWPPYVGRRMICELARVP